MDGETIGSCRDQGDRDELGWIDLSCFIAIKVGISQLISLKARTQPISEQPAQGSILPHGLVWMQMNEQRK